MLAGLQLCKRPRPAARSYIIFYAERAHRETSASLGRLNYYCWNLINDDVDGSVPIFFPLFRLALLLLWCFVIWTPGRGGNCKSIVEFSFVKFFDGTLWRRGYSLFFGDYCHWRLPLDTVIDVVVWHWLLFGDASIIKDAEIVIPLLGEYIFACFRVTLLVSDFYTFSNYNNTSWEIYGAELYAKIRCLHLFISCSKLLPWVENVTRKLNWWKFSSQRLYSLLLLKNHESGSTYFTASLYTRVISRYKRFTPLTSAKCT